MYKNGILHSVSHAQGTRAEYFLWGWLLNVLKGLQESEPILERVPGNKLFLYEIKDFLDRIRFFGYTIT